MVRYTPINLSQLPPPAALEVLDYELLRKLYVEDLDSRLDGQLIVVESDPSIKVLEASAYREMLVRGRVNDGVRAVLLATAQGSDLDHIAGTYYGIHRQLISREIQTPGRLCRRYMKTTKACVGGLNSLRRAGRLLAPEAPTCGTPSRPPPT